MHPINIVGIIDEDPFDFRTWSGSSKFFFEALTKEGVLVRALSADPGKMRKMLAKLTAFYPNIDEWRRRYHLNTYLFQMMSKTAIEKLMLIKDSFEVILQVGAWYNISNCKQLKDKFYCSYHDGNLATQLRRPDISYNLKSKYIQNGINFERNVYQGLDLIFPMSEWLRRSFIEDFNCEPDKVIAVGAGVNLKYIPKIQEKDYTKHNILFIGVDFERKGGKILLEAFRVVRNEIKDAKLFIVGPNLTGLPDGVESLGRIMKNSLEGEERLHTAYLDATIFVMPSYYEPFGIVFAEAMAHKLPCIGTDNCAMPEIIDNEINGFIVPPGDSKSLAHKIVDLFRNEKKIEEYGKAGYVKYLNNYTWEKVSRKIVDACASKL